MSSFGLRVDDVDDPNAGSVSRTTMPPPLMTRAALRRIFGGHCYDGVQIVQVPAHERRRRRRGVWATSRTVRRSG
jgi:hypothetical protein